MVSLADANTPPDQDDAAPAFGAAVLGRKLRWTAIDLDRFDLAPLDQVQVERFTENLDWRAIQEDARRTVRVSTCAGGHATAQNDVIAASGFVNQLHTGYADE